MKEYYQCKRCYSNLAVHQIARHHTKVHPDVPHDIYLDQFFDLDRPIFKCDFCSCKLTQKRLIKHLQRAHLFDNHSFRANSLPFTQAVPAASSSTMPVIELSSDSEVEMLMAKMRKQLTKSDKSVQCDSIEGRLVDNSFGTHDAMNDATAHSEQRTFNEIGIQTSEKLSISPIKKCMQLSLEYDKDDGWVELVLS